MKMVAVVLRISILAVCSFLGRFMVNEKWGFVSCINALNKVVTSVIPLITLNRATHGPPFRGS